MIIRHWDGPGEYVVIGPGYSPKYLREPGGLVAFERFLGLLRIIRKAILNQLEVFEIVLLAKPSQKNITQTKETRGDTQNSTILMLVTLGVA